MSDDQWFSFGGESFDSVVAHGGNAPILTRRVFEGHEASHCRFVDLSVVPSGAEIGVHTHEADNHELYVVIEGRGRMHLDGKEFEVGPGDVVLNRPGGTHGLTNVGAGDLRLVVVEVTAKAANAP